MASKGTPNAEQTVELMVETIRERILDRIDELESSKTEMRRGRSRGSYKRIDRATYDAIGKLEKQLKSLNRGLGAILTSDPNAIINPKTEETWGGLVKSLLNDNVQGEELASKLESFQSFVYTSRGIVPGKVGHHRTALNILREVLKDKPFDYRTKFKEIAKKNGYEIGEEFVDFIDPAAHKEFTKHVKGKLNKLGIKLKTDIPEALKDSLINRYAHAKQFGGNPGFEVPRGWLRDDVDPDTLFKFSKPYLEASKRSSIAGLQIDDILEKGDWETSDDLIKQLDKVALNQTDDLFDIYGNSLRPGVKPQFPLGETGVKNTQINPEAVEKLGLSLDHINPELLKGDGIITKAIKLVQKVDEAIPIKAKIAAGTALTLLDPIDVIAGESQARSEKGDTERSKYLRGAGKLRSASGQTGIGATLSGTRNPLLTGALGLASVMSGLSSARAQHLGETYQSDTEKVIDNLKPEPKHIPADTDTGVAEIGEYDPYVGISSL